MFHVKVGQGIGTISTWELNGERQHGQFVCTRLEIDGDWPRSKQQRVGTMLASEKIPLENFDVLLRSSNLRDGCEAFA